MIRQALTVYRAIFRTPEGGVQAPSPARRGLNRTEREQETDWIQWEVQM